MAGLVFVGCNHLSNGKRLAAESCDPAAHPGKHVVCLKERVEGGGRVCSADPAALNIESGDKVIFVTAPDMQAKDVEFRQVGSTALTFEKGKPTKIEKGKSHDSGSVTSATGGRYVYKLDFRDGSTVVCRVDPVICVPPPGLIEECN